jgi:toxin ParE1/3/4
MSRARFSPLALGDVREILDYIALDKPDAAVTFVERLETFCQGLADRPTSGTGCSHLAPELRCVSFGRYVVYFRPANVGIEVVRIIHGARDAERLFPPDASK